MARRPKNFQFASAQIDCEAVMDEVRNPPRLGGVRFWIEAFWQFAAELVGCNFGLSIFARTFGVLPREIGVHPVDERELPVAADVVVVGVRIENHHRARGQFRGDFVNVADAHAGVEEHGLLGADNQIRNGLFRLMRLVDGKNSGRDFVDFKPGLVGKNALERFVFRAGQGFAPFRNLLFLLRLQGCRNEKQESQWHRRNDFHDRPCLPKSRPIKPAAPEERRGSFVGTKTSSTSPDAPGMS